MGPRSFERGDCLLQPSARSQSSALQWGRALSSAETHMMRTLRVSSSGLQWGRALSSAETRRTLADCETIHNLQWGRALSSAETFSQPRGFFRRTMPSMGPRSFERGDRAEALTRAQRQAPSMGPRSFERGDGSPRHRQCRLRPPFNGAALFRARRLRPHKCLVVKELVKRLRDLPPRKAQNGARRATRNASGCAAGHSAPRAPPGVPTPPRRSHLEHIVSKVLRGSRL